MFTRRKNSWGDREIVWSNVFIALALIIGIVALFN